MFGFTSVLKALSLSFLASIFLFCLPLNDALAKAGCCSKHGGVKGCNTRTNHLLCKDGTDSPTCLCTGGTEYKSKTKKNQPKMNTEQPTTSPTPTTPMAIPKGCCSRHGGVASCDTKSGYFVCKDGTRSATCRCR